jgi:hypothetical protein
LFPRGVITGFIPVIQSARTEIQQLACLDCRNQCGNDMKADSSMQLIEMTAFVLEQAPQSANYNLPSFAPGQI